MSPDVAAFLLDLVNRQTLNVGSSDFDEAVAMVQKARAELGAALQEEAQ